MDQPPYTMMQPADKPLRVAVLECDTPIPPVLEKFGTYGDCFERLLIEGLSALRNSDTPQIDFSKWDVVGARQYPERDSVDALIITGSKHDAFVDDEWILQLVSFVRGVLEGGRIKIAAFCFGHQIVARALGVTVARCSAWEVSVSKIDLTAEGKEIFESDELHLHQMHRDIVLQVPPGTINLGKSQICAVQGLSIPGRFLTLQSHPEFNSEIMVAILSKRHGDGIFSKAAFEDGIARARKSLDRRAVAKAVARLFWS